MPVINFTRQNAKQGAALAIETGANNISWSYGLNTQSYPTYGGEVVQILSSYVDNIKIVGEVNSYSKAEEIYRFFIDYLHESTQGDDTGIRYAQGNVTMFYPERGWTILIRPISLPGFRIGRDVVVPTYEIEAAVVEPAPEMIEMSTAQAELGKFDRVTADVGYEPENPFSDPAFAFKGEALLQKTEAEKKKKKADAKDKKEPSAADYDPKAAVDHAADFFNKLVDSYADHDFKYLIDLAFDIAGPAGAGAKRPGDSTATTDTQGKISNATAEKIGRALNAPTKPGAPFVAPGGPANASP